MPGSAYVTPYTFVPLEVLTAAKLNAMQDNLRSLKVWAAAGDLLYAYDADQLERLAIGANGQVLTVSAGLPSWAALPVINNRQGGSALAWDTPGATGYSPGNVRIQLGATSLTYSSESSKSGVITYPVAYLYTPLVMLSIIGMGFGAPNPYSIYSLPSASLCNFSLGFTSSWSGDVTVAWLAIGPVA